MLVIAQGRSNCSWCYRTCLFATDALQQLFYSTFFYLNQVLVEAKK